MLVVPAWVWRYPLALRAVIVGLAVGVVLALLVLLGSSSPLAGLVALVVISVLQGTLLARRMAKGWPGAKSLSGTDRVTVVRAARGGDPVADRRMAQGVVDYSQELRDAYGRRRLYRWLMVALAVATFGVAVLDTMTAPASEAAVSWIYFAFFPVETVWWPRRQLQLLANAERATKSARQVLAEQVNDL
ncbi:MAG TPA: hypothetical protein VFB19_00340 [Mycobacterium sp.]|nr:hypothetical protein [Mycobacterium sp.]